MAKRTAATTETKKTTTTKNVVMVATERVWREDVPLKWVPEGELFTLPAKEVPHYVKERFARPATKEDIEDAKERATVTPQERR